MLAVLLVLAAGSLLAPTATTASTLLDRVAPAGTVTEAFTVMVMSIVAGTAAGNALGGAIVDGASYEAGALMAAGIAVLGRGGRRGAASDLWRRSPRRSGAARR